MSDTFDLAQFKKDLRNVLVKHNVDIGVNLEGDTHCLGTTFVVHTAGGFGKDYVLAPHAHYLDASDLK